MLNADGQRELAYVVRINDIQPIEGSDNCECAVVGGWHIMVRKETFKVGDLAIYFEIDSKVDCSKPEFEFLAKRNGKIKTQKYTFGGKGNFISQGLLMAPSDFGWEYNTEKDAIVVKSELPLQECLDEGTFLTERFGVKYADAEDNKRKANSVDKYKKMAMRHQKLFKKKPIRWLMRYSCGRKILFFFFGKKKDKKSGWPVWVSKTDEERVQNMPWILNDKDPWIATEKIDGTSTTFTMRRKKFGKYDFYICSRNVVFDKPDKQCFYETNVYTEMAEKYHIEDFLKDILSKDKNLEWVTLQGETYGEGIQKRGYGLKEHKFMAFNFITSKDGRWNSVEAKKLTETYDIPWVPILNTEFILPDTVDEILAIATGKSTLDEEMREGIVFRSQDGIKSFKAVSNEFLLKYHN